MPLRGISFFLRYNPKYLLGLFFILFFVKSASFAQEQLPESQLNKDDLFAHLSYLASDELMGRRTGQPGNDSAAAYLARFFDTHGLIPKGNEDNYFQFIDFEQTFIPTEGMLAFNDFKFIQNDNMLILKGQPLQDSAKLVFAGHGLTLSDNGIDDYEGIDVKGKIVLVLPGTPDQQDPLTISKTAPIKRRIAQEKGAIAVIEIYRLGFPWSFFQRYFSKGSMDIATRASDSEDTITYGWIKEENIGDLNAIIDDKKFTKGFIKHSGANIQSLKSQNVIGLVEGTDKKLKHEYIIVTGHYDHVGAGSDGGGFYSKEDSIFNGARDNAMGTVALMATARSISDQPTKRSVLFIAFTGEELGLLGSKYYVDNPVVPLSQSIFNINTDGAGYNDTTIVSVIGYGRTGIDSLFHQGAKFADLNVFPNPAPRQNLYDRSDNVSFAIKGIPAVNISPGVTDFDAEIQQYYHQVSDEVDSISTFYLLKYAQAISNTTRLVANSTSRPMWVKGDKYEEAGRQLYELTTE